ncbi:MAG: ParB/RepB/Spo0J family partition protein [Oscillospiraceae bacterium]
MYSLFNAKEKTVQKVIMIPLTSIVPNKSQPREYFDEISIMSLAESIRENGIIQPVCVRQNGAIYEIISGERRCRAAKLAGLSEIPCIVLRVDDEKSAVLALIENIQRSDLSFFEEAIAIEKLISVYGMTQQEAARKLGKAQSTIANKLRLLRFTDAERNLIITGNISERQARMLIRIGDENVRLCILHEVIKKQLSLEQTEKLVDSALGAKNKVSGRKKSSIFKLPFPKIYINSINQIVSRMKNENIKCETITNMNDSFYEYTIRIPINSPTAS